MGEEGTLEGVREVGRMMEGCRKRRRMDGRRDEGEVDGGREGRQEEELRR